MIVVPCEQGSPEWVASRLGVPTASQFSRLITPKTGNPSTSADGYQAELIAEWLTGEPVGDWYSQWMERGRELEEQALLYYELQRDTDVERVGFCTTDDGMAGCSPDGLVGEDGGLEIKCLGVVKHVRAMIDLEYNPKPTEHYAQVQGSLLVTGRQWWDYCLYHPTLPPVVIRYERDDVFLAKLEKILKAFTAQFREAQEKLIARGYHPPDERVASWIADALERSVSVGGSE